MPFSYWPGGIPSYVKFDGVPIADDKVDELTNGWKLFVKVKSCPSINCFPLYGLRGYYANIDVGKMDTQTIRRSKPGI